jgi:septal ring factor EnvC (AmiA/AmiB activator)
MSNDNNNQRVTATEPDSRRSTSLTGECRHESAAGLAARAVGNEELELDQRFREIATLSQLLLEAEERASSLEQELRASIAREQRLTRQIDHQRQELQEIASLPSIRRHVDAFRHPNVSGGSATPGSDSVRLQLEAEKTELQAQIKAKDERITALEQRLADIESSLIWKLSSPLRVGALFKRK